jgi:hypothetical protein
MVACLPFSNRGGWSRSWPAEVASCFGRVEAYENNDCEADSFEVEPA